MSYEDVVKTPDCECGPSSTFPAPEPGKLPLVPLKRIVPFWPCYGRFDLTTYLRGWSDYEIMMKLCCLVNEMIKQGNSLTEIINQLVNANIPEFIRKWLMHGWVDVRNPLGGIEGAKGDGVADDTDAINNVIQWAHDNGCGLVYFPNGTYNTRGVVLQENVSLVGADRYHTIIRGLPGAIDAIVKGHLWNAYFCNFTVNANSSVQVNHDVCAVSVSIKDCLLYSLILQEGMHNAKIASEGTDVYHCQVHDVVAENSYACAIVLDSFGKGANFEFENILFNGINGDSTCMTVPLVPYGFSSPTYGYFNIMADCIVTILNAVISSTNNKAIIGNVTVNYSPIIVKALSNCHNVVAKIKLASSTVVLPAWFTKANSTSLIQYDAQGRTYVTKTATFLTANSSFHVNVGSEGKVADNDPDRVFFFEGGAFRDWRGVVDGRFTFNYKDGQKTLHFYDKRPYQCQTNTNVRNIMVDNPDGIRELGDFLGGIGGDIANIENRLTEATVWQVRDRSKIATSTSVNNYKLDDIIESSMTVAGDDYKLTYRVKQGTSSLPWDINMGNNQYAQYLPDDDKINLAVCDLDSRGGDITLLLQQAVEHFHEIILPHRSDMKITATIKFIYSDRLIHGYGHSVVRWAGPPHSVVFKKDPAITTKSIENIEFRDIYFETATDYIDFYETSATSLYPDSNIRFIDCSFLFNGNDASPINSSSLIRASGYCSKLTIENCDVSGLDDFVVVAIGPNAGSTSILRIANCLVTARTLLNIISGSDPEALTVVGCRLIGRGSAQVSGSPHTVVTGSPAASWAFIANQVTGFDKFHAGITVPGAGNSITPK